MRIRELVHPKHRHRMQQFVKVNIEMRTKTLQQTMPAGTPVTMSKPAVTEQKQLPLFIETIFKAKDFDPL